MATSSTPAPSSASISIRKYIYIVGPFPLPPGIPIPYTSQLHISNPLQNTYPPSEPTSTLVLTSPKSTFVDIRILKPLSTTDADLPNTGGPRFRVDWAFAGKSRSYPVCGDWSEGVEDVDAEGKKVVRHAVFVHEVSTRHAVDAGAEDVLPDEGDMYVVGEGLDLEVGKMWNPGLGIWQVYEEMWEDVKVKNVEGVKVAVVLRLETPEARARGIVVRVGQFCQGILRVGEDWVVERWEFERRDVATGTQDGDETEEKVQGGAWKRMVRVGDLFLPCAVTFRSDILVQGGISEYKGAQWVVDELAEWDDDRE
ncbi:hypothetical protein B0J11DRAFT_46313 [Dendryphion nanum]|uniref:Protein HRI1 n=1 Tax=Dendryphion nanum TaxID=256645 RepID=A0A9P9IZF1_9PLEO|nr:hypothetical protein B0J11DRAFT_46313 [Dendryphion nanum]